MKEAFSKYYNIKYVPIELYYPKHGQLWLDLFMTVYKYDSSIYNIPHGVRLMYIIINMYVELLNAVMAILSITYKDRAKILYGKQPAN